MKRFEIPMVATSLVGLCLSAGFGVPAAHADFTFGQAVDLGPTINSPGLNCGPCPAPDGKQLYFTRWTGVADNEIWVSRRATVDDAWGPPTRLGPPLDTNMDEVPSFTADGLSLYFDGSREGGSGGMDLWMTTSTTPYDDWGAPVNLGPVVNSDADEWSACISADGLELYFSSTRKEGFGSFDLWMTTRATTADAWGPAVHLDAPLNTPEDDCWPGLSSDGLVLFFTSSRPGGFGAWDLYMTRRASRNDPWGAPTNLGPKVNIRVEGQGGPKVSFDGSMLYFYAVMSSGDEAMQLDIFQSPIIPTVDFNADSKVDLGDLVMLIDNWGTDNTLYDIGPYAWGDGVVDIEDLKAFIAEWEKESQSTQGDGTTFPDFVATEGSAEGVVVDETGNVYVSVRAASDQVWKFSAAGVGSVLADLGEPGGGAVGLALDAAGNVYACRGLTGSGVYRIAPDGQTVMLPGTEQIVFPNSLVFDNQETLYITETFSGDLAAGSFGQGGIWRLKKGGTAELWLRDELLTGLAPSFFPYPVGANGIGLYQGDLYVANTDKAIIVRVPVQPDGSAGQPESWKQAEDVPESIFYSSPVFPLMLDGLILDAEGNVYVAVPSRNAVVRINANDRSQETIAVYPEVPLDAPVSLAFGTGATGGETLFITNLGMCSVLIPDQTWPGPGLVKTHIQGDTDQ